MKNNAKYLFFRHAGKIKNTKKGFTIIEALTVLFIFVLITLSFYSIFSVGLRLIADAKNRLGAMSIANEKMEIVRNLAYTNIGTVLGTVTGNISDDEDVIENTRQFHVHTLVLYKDDAFDGKYPADLIPNDYKNVVITVSWSGINSVTEKVELSSRFVPPGLEVINPGDGILSINVFSDQPGGTGIPSSSVRITNGDIAPVLDTTVNTDSTGNIFLIGDKIKNSIQKYQIAISKSGYEIVNTMPPYPDTPYSPIDVHASVVIGSLNIINIVQNKLAILKISTSDYLGTSVGNINFDILGGRKLGYEVDSEGKITSIPVYNLKLSTQTGSDGEKDFGSISPGQYTVTLPSSVTDAYKIIGKDPIDSFTLFSDDTVDLEIKLASKTATSLMVKVLSDETGNPPVSGALVNLTKTGYDNTLTTGADGIVFFPSTSDTFESGTYNLKITKAEFQENNSEVIINNNQLKEENITLTSS
jgi:hypothetical protein